MFRRYGAFAGLFTAAKELRRTPSFEVELDIDSSCCLLQSLAKPWIAKGARADGMEIRHRERFATPRIGIGIWKCF